MQCTWVNSVQHECRVQRATWDARSKQEATNGPNVSVVWQPSWTRSFCEIINCVNEEEKSDSGGRVKDLHVLTITQVHRVIVRITEAPPIQGGSGLEDVKGWNIQRVIQLECEVVEVGLVHSPQVGRVVIAERVELGVTTCKNTSRIARMDEQILWRWTYLLHNALSGML